ncbi:DUF5616 domain-containing protein [Chryseobacterium wangxinyae]|uniref:DUF5616 domain-containing protein n=1 Tax=Chryseobacterium sp. CY353 TaxID=2997334 RepID=UPI00226D8074|nr:DUF5616 domain-containing protein [Chryseobacterium sp. CY353]MCY0967521.1 DUF5616 domain-containing protein [Chryseobacterium sp. CY353]
MKYEQRKSWKNTGDDTLFQPIKELEKLKLAVQNIKQLEISDLKNKTIHNDGFNILILLESLLSEAYIFQGLDGCFRDLSGVYGTWKN